MRIISVIVALLLLPALSAARADDDDQDWARNAVLSGEAVPLAHIIDSIETAYKGKIYEVELLKSDDTRTAPIYQLKLVSDDGFLIELTVDASSGQLVGIGGQGIGDDNEIHEEPHHDEEKEIGN